MGTCTPSKVSICPQGLISLPPSWSLRRRKLCRSRIEAGGRPGGTKFSLPLPASTLLDTPSTHGEETACSACWEHCQVPLPSCRQPHAHHPLAQGWTGLPWGASHWRHSGESVASKTICSSIVTPRWAPWIKPTVPSLMRKVAAGPQKER